MIRLRCPRLVSNCIQLGLFWQHMHFSPLDSSILKPHFYLSLGQIQGIGQVHSFMANYILLLMKFSLHPFKLFRGKNSSGSFSTCWIVTYLFSSNLRKIHWNQIILINSRWQYNQFLAFFNILWNLPVLNQLTPIKNITLNCFFDIQISTNIRLKNNRLEPLS